MIIPVSTISLFGADGGASAEPIIAVVESCDDQRTVVVIEAADCERCSIGSRCEVRYTDPRDGRFMGASCVIESLNQERLTLVDMTETRSVNQRSSFRVSMVCSDITAQVGNFEQCRVIDISASGIRVHTPRALAVGASVPVQFNANGQDFRGAFTVRRVNESQAGAQIGLSADPEDRRLNESLTELALDIQRVQLRRRSGVSSRDGGAADEGIENAGEVGADEARDDHDRASPGCPSEDAWIRVPASVLAGRALPGPLVTGEGSVIAAGGQVLSMDDLHRLGKEGAYATDDWSFERVERRATERAGCERIVRVVALRGERVIEMRADLTDISRGGVGLRTAAMVDEHAYLAIDFSNANGRRWIIGKVVHNRIGEGETPWRLGVQFYMNSPQTGPVPDSVPAFARWISVKPDRGSRSRVAG